MLPEKDILPRIKSYLEKTGIAHTTFGKLADNNPMLVRKLEGGMQASPAKRVKLIRWMEAYPEGPPGVRRHLPKPEETASPPPEPPQVFRGPSHLEKDAHTAPAPSISVVEPSIVSAIKAEAFKRRLPLSEFLSDLVSLGWLVYQDDLKESEKKHG